MKAERRGLALLLERPCRAVLRNGAIDRKAADIVNDTTIIKTRRDENAKGRSDKARLARIERLTTQSALRNFYELPRGDEEYCLQRQGLRPQLHSHHVRRR